MKEYLLSKNLSGRISWSMIMATRATSELDRLTRNALGIYLDRMVIAKLEVWRTGEF